MGKARRRKRQKAAVEEKPQARRNWPWILGIAAPAVLLLCAPLLAHEDLPRGSDVYSITHYLSGFLGDLRDGIPVPGWSPETNLGLGGPAFVLFPPLFFYAASAAVWLAGGVISGLKLYLLGVAAASALAFYWLARDWAGPGLPAAAGAALYLLLPYHVLDMYQRFAIPETTAFIFLPLILLFARRALRGGGAGAFTGLVLSYAGLIYTHLVSTLLFSLLLGAWILWEGWGRWRDLARVIAALALGAAVAAPAVIPPLVEKANVNIDWVKEMPNGDFRINFIFKDDVLPVLGFKDPVKPLVLRSAHAQLLLAGAAAFLALAGGAAGARDRRRLVAGVAAGCGIAYFLQLRLSTPLWLAIPELPTIQFPWRFQTVMVLSAALLAAFALAAHAGAGRRKTVWVVLVVLTVPNLYLAQQFAYKQPFTFDGRILELMAGPKGWIEPSLTPVEFDRYKRIRYEKMTMPDDGFAGGEGEVQVAERSSAARRLEIASDSGGTVLARLFWFPGWKGRIDGQPLELGPSSRDGLVSFQVPPGEHSVDLVFGMTPLRRASWWIAGLSLAGCLGFAVFSKTRAGSSSASIPGDPAEA